MTGWVASVYDGQYTKKGPYVICPDQGPRCPHAESIDTIVLYMSTKRECTDTHADLDLLCSLMT